MKLLKEYFAIVEDMAFGNRLAKYKATFTEEKLNTEKEKLEAPLILKNIHDIMKKSREEFKEFILLKDKSLSPARCVAFNKIHNIQKLLKKFIDDPQYDQIILETDSLLNSINTIITNIDILSYYGIAKDKESLENSLFKTLPEEMIVKIFYYVDGDINLKSKVDILAKDCVTSTSEDN